MEELIADQARDEERERWTKLVADFKSATWHRRSSAPNEVSPSAT